MKVKNKYYIFFITLIFSGFVIFIFKNEFFQAINTILYKNPVKIGNVLIHYKNGLAYDKDESTIVIYDQARKKYTIYCNAKFNVSHDQLSKFISLMKLKHNFHPKLEGITINNIHYLKSVHEDSSKKYTSIFWAPEKHFLCEFYGDQDNYPDFLSMLDQLEFQ